MVEKKGATPLSASPHKRGDAAAPVRTQNRIVVGLKLLAAYCQSFFIIAIVTKRINMVTYC